VFYSTGRTYNEVVLEQSAEDNIWTDEVYEAGNNYTKIALMTCRFDVHKYVGLLLDWLNKGK
jgi:predicted NAD-dependent protein-ADP-ribosyltransferase YbiA (DUF1768 family)